jgi:hypothetical protein
MTELNLSKETILFQNKKVENTESMQGLSRIPLGMPRCQNPLQAPFQQTPDDLMREKVRSFRQSLMYTVPEAVREQAVDTLNLLIRFDKTISMNEARVLMDAVKIITAKGLPA